jgi:hypothetical protein
MRAALSRFRSVGAAVLVGSTCLAAGSVGARAEDVTLQGITIADDEASVLFPRIEVTGTNLSEAELRKLFTKTTPAAEVTDLVGRMKAARISIPETQVSLKGGKFTLRDFLVTDVDSGRTGKLSLGSLDGNGVGKDSQPATVHSNAISIENGDFAGVIAAARSHDAADLKFKMSRMTWGGFDLTAADKDTPADALGGNLWRVHMDSFDASINYDGDIPLKGAAEVKSLTVEPPRASNEGKSLAQLGYDKLDFGILTSGNYDPATKTYTLDNYAMKEARSGTLALRSKLGSLDRSAFIGSNESRLAALLNGDVSLVSLRFDNAGLFEKALAYFAAQQKKPVDTIRRQWAGAATQFIPFLMGGDPAGLKIAEAANKFIANPKSLTLTATPRGAPVKFTEFMAMKADPSEILGRVQLDAVTP